MGHPAPGRACTAGGEAGRVSPETPGLQRGSDWWPLEAGQPAGAGTLRDWLGEHIRLSLVGSTLEGGPNLKAAGSSEGLAFWANGCGGCALASWAARGELLSHTVWSLSVFSASERLPRSEKAQESGPHGLIRKEARPSAAWDTASSPEAVGPGASQRGT